MTASLDFVSLLGFLAGALTTIAFVPQLVRSWRSRSVKDMSLGMLTIFCTGVALWLIYGLLIHSWPVIVANVITLILAGAILILKLKYG
jgi:MtN3 and saliva related transmembrane protein